MKKEEIKIYFNSHSIIRDLTDLVSRVDTLFVREVDLHVFLEIEEGKLIILSETK